MPSHLQFPIRGDKIAMRVAVTDLVHSRQTEFQKIEVYDTEALGKVLFLDGHVQLAEMDEHAYHEALVHIPMLSIDNAKRVLVVGAGDGGVLRELVKHKNLQTIDMVEIDAGVIEVSKQYLPSLSDGAFEDPRVNLHIADAFPFLKNVTNPYDLIVMDVTDVYEEEDGALSEQLFTQNFYRDCLNALTLGGMLVTQADNHVFCPYSLNGILDVFGEVFPKTGAYQAVVPSFGGYSAFAWASKGAQPPAQMPQSDSAFRYLTPARWAFAFDMLRFGC